MLDEERAQLLAYADSLKSRVEPLRVLVSTATTRKQVDDYMSEVDMLVHEMRQFLWNCDVREIAIANKVYRTENNVRPPKPTLDSLLDF